MARFSFTSLILLALQGAAIPMSRRSIGGPVIESNFPDPSFIEVDGTYYAFGTNNGVTVPWATSTDFNTWTVQQGSALNGAGSWSNGVDVWAPDVVQIASTPSHSRATLLTWRL